MLKFLLEYLFLPGYLKSFLHILMFLMLSSFFMMDISASLLLPYVSSGYAYGLGFSASFFILMISLGLILVKVVFNKNIHPSRQRTAGADLFDNFNYSYVLLWRGVFRLYVLVAILSALIVLTLNMKGVKLIQWPSNMIDMSLILLLYLNIGYFVYSSYQGYRAFLHAKNENIRGGSLELPPKTFLKIIFIFFAIILLTVLMAWVGSHDLEDISTLKLYMGSILLGLIIFLGAIVFYAVLTKN